MADPWRSSHRIRHDLSRQRRAAMRKYVLLAGAMLVIAFCGTFLLFRFVGYHGSDMRSKNRFSSGSRSRTGLLVSDQCQAVCYTKECIKTASDILEMLDPAIQPCEDFYRYACGGFKRELTQHTNRERYLWSVEYKAINFFEELIKQIPHSVSDSTFGSLSMKLKNFYDSCMDPRSLEENAIPTALKYLDHFGIKHWPYLDDDYRFDNPDLDEVLTMLFLYDQKPLFLVRGNYIPSGNGTRSYDVANYQMNLMVSIQRGQIFHSKGVMEEHKMQLMEEVLESLVPNDTLRDKMLTEVLAFDLEIANVTQRTNERVRQCKMNDTTACSEVSPYDCVQEGGYQKEDRWCKIVKKILERSGFSKKNPDMPLSLQNGEHFRKLGELLERANQRTIAHTLAIQFFVEKATSMNFGLRRKTVFDGKPILKKHFHEMNENRSPFCAAWACYRLPKLAEIAFYKSEYENTELRREINEIYSDIKEIFVSSLKNITWIDPTAKEALEESFSKITFSPESSQYTNISTDFDLYEEVQITTESFLANELESQKLEVIFHLRNMDAAKMSGIESYPFAFTPHYSFGPHAISFELANFMFPVVTSHRPRYANLGTLGFVLGHEMTHAAEFLLSTCEKSEAFENALMERVQCLVNHYSQYETYTTGEKVDGERTYSENIADYLGIRAAFKSFEKYIGDGEMFPGLNFTHEQMFFIIVAQNFCEVNNLESQTAYLSDAHSPSNVRIYGTFKNFDAFWRAFSCASGSPMNPVSKCVFE